MQWANASQWWSPTLFTHHSLLLNNNHTIHCYSTTTTSLPSLPSLPSLTWLPSAHALHARPNSPKNSSSDCCSPGSLAMVSSTYARTLAPSSPRLPNTYSNNRQSYSCTWGAVERGGWKEGWVERGVGEKVHGVDSTCSWCIDGCPPTPTRFTTCTCTSLPPPPNQQTNKSLHIPTPTPGRVHLQTQPPAAS